MSGFKPNPNLLADNLAAGYSNPILYLPLKDAATAHINTGTGGDFVQNGTLATADRGANQDNCVASNFNGSTDYLANSSMNGSTSSVFTTSFIIKTDTILNSKRVFAILDSPTSDTGRIQAVLYDTGRIQFNFQNTSDTLIGNINTPNDTILPGRTCCISLVVDMSSESLCKLTINGIVTTPVIYSYINGTLPTDSLYMAVGNYNESFSSLLDGDLGELYFDTNYIDLATDNPFWDATTNRPNSVRKVMRDIGSNPLIALPISADNPGKNYGSGGDFTLFG